MKKKKKKNKNFWLGIAFAALAVCVFAVMAPSDVLHWIGDFHAVKEVCPYLESGDAEGSESFGRPHLHHLKPAAPQQSSAGEDVDNRNEIGSVPTITEDELAQFDGRVEGKPIYLAISYEVYDVTSEARFYAPGATYHVFAGKHCTRALSLGSLEEQDIEKRHDVSDFDEAQREEMNDRIVFYRQKYGPKVANLERPPPGETTTK